MSSLRDANFQLYIETLDSLVSKSYSRWLSIIHLRDMRSLQNDHTQVANHFENGKVVIKKIHCSFSSIAIDHAHQQNNSALKDDGGAIGLMDDMSKLTRWLVAGPEMARVIGEFKESAGNIKRKQSKSPDVKHHIQVKYVPFTFVKQVKSLCETMEEMSNTFEETLKIC